MNSERELFEEWASSETGWDLYWSDHINQYMDHQTNGAWLSWQASTQRQGYKLVPVEPTKQMISAGMGIFSFPLDNGRFSDCELIFSYREMIGAVNE